MAYFFAATVGDKAVRAVVESDLAVDRIRQLMDTLFEFYILTDISWCVCDAHGTWIEFVYDRFPHHSKVASKEDLFTRRLYFVRDGHRVELTAARIRSVVELPIFPFAELVEHDRSHLEDEKKNEEVRAKYTHSIAALEAQIDQARAALKKMKEQLKAKRNEMEHQIIPSRSFLPMNSFLAAQPLVAPTVRFPLHGMR